MHEIWMKNSVTTHAGDRCRLNTVDLPEVTSSNYKRIYLYVKENIIPEKECWTDYKLKNHLRSWMISPKSGVKLYVIEGWCYSTDLVSNLYRLPFIFIHLNIVYPWNEFFTLRTRKKKNTTYEKVIAIV